jgi:hypothetical protein
LVFTSGDDHSLLVSVNREVDDQFSSSKKVERRLDSLIHVCLPDLIDEVKQFQTDTEEDGTSRSRSEGKLQHDQS